MDEELIRAIFWFTADYHSGQSSRGYRINSKAWRKLRRNGLHSAFIGPLGNRGSTYYTALVDNYQNKV